MAEVLRFPVELARPHVEGAESATPARVLVLPVVRIERNCGGLKSLILKPGDEILPRLRTPRRP